MAILTVVKTIGSTGTFSTIATWQAGAPADLTTAQKFAAGTFLVAAFIQGESLTFTGSGATGVLLDTDSIGAGSGTYVVFGISSGTPAAGDLVTGGSSGATCILSGVALNTGIIWQGQCQNQAFSSSTALCFMNGSTSSTVAYKHLTTVPGASFRDNAGAQSNALQFNSSNGASLTVTGSNQAVVAVNELYAHVSNLQLAGTHATAARGLSISTTGVIVDDIITEASNTSSTAGVGPLGVDIGTGNVIRNSLIVQRASSADHILGIGSGSGGGTALYNCDFVAPSDLAVAPSHIVRSTLTGHTFENCALFCGAAGSALTIGVGGTFSFTTCETDINTPPAGVTQVTYGNEFVSTANATRDFRLKLGASAIDAGTTDTTNAAFDIVGTARPNGPAYDIGCWEFVQAPSPVPVQLSHPEGFFHGMGRMGLRG